jgi:hypothetical protein
MVRDLPGSATYDTLCMVFAFLLTIRCHMGWDGMSCMLVLYENDRRTLLSHSRHSADETQRFFKLLVAVLLNIIQAFSTINHIQHRSHHDHHFHSPAVRS